VASTEKKLEAQTKKAGELQSEVQAGVEKLSSSAAAVAALEAQLISLQSQAAAQAMAAQTLVEQTVAAAADVTALRQALGVKPVRRAG